MRITTTASRLPRAMACPPSEALPHVESTSPWAEAGTSIHRFLELVPTIGAEAALEAITDPEVRERCAALDLTKLPLDLAHYSGEVRMAWNPETDEARTFGQGEEPPEGWFPGRPDVVAVTEDKTIAYVADFKSGDAYVAPPEKNWQVKGQAVLARKALGVKAVLGQIILLRRGQDPLPLTQRWDAGQLDYMAVQLKDLFRKINDTRQMLVNQITPKVVLGPHCRYCPAFQYCPGQTRLVRVLGGMPELVVDEVTSMLTPGNAGDAWKKLQAAKALINVLEEAVKRYAEEVGGFEVGDGMVYGPMLRPHDAVDPEKAYQVLLEDFGQEVADRASKLSVTKESIEEALRPLKGEGVTIKSLKERAFGALREAGAIKAVQRPETRLHRG